MIRLLESSIVLGLAIAAFSLAQLAIHPPNANKLCARPGCGHYKYSHQNGNGACEYVDIFTPAGHCEGFIHAR